MLLYGVINKLEDNKSQANTARELTARQTDRERDRQRDQDRAAAESGKNNQPLAFSSSHTMTSQDSGTSTGSGKSERGILKAGGGLT